MAETIHTPAISLAEETGQLLFDRGYTLGTAESCTGGNIAHLLTTVPGSSAYFLGSVVSYSNAVKHEVLGVSASDLDQYGAVSQPVVEQMARGIQRLLHCDCAVATSGIAGPGGGTSEKPVGTVWIAAACRDKLKASLYHFSGSRSEIIQQSSEAALIFLNELLQSDTV